MDRYGMTFTPLEWCIWVELDRRFGSKGDNRRENPTIADALRGMGWTERALETFDQDLERMSRRFRAWQDAGSPTRLPKAKGTRERKPRRVPPRIPCEYCKFTIDVTHYKKHIEARHPEYLPINEWVAVMTRQ